MRYTLPCEDTINLPHLKALETIGISADNLTYDKKNLAGDIIISGDYTQDNCEDMMEFTHEIPVEFLIDDEKINPEVNITNFIYDVLPGKGIEVRFDLEIILNEITVGEVERDKDYEELQKQVEEGLDNVLNNKEVTPEQRDADKNDNQDNHDNPDNNDDYDDYNNLVENDDHDDNYLKMEVKQDKVEFNPGFIPKEKDKYTTYKIITLDEGETVDDCLFRRNLSRKLLVREHEFGSNKIILKIEHE